METVDLKATDLLEKVQKKFKFKKFDEYIELTGTLRLDAMELLREIIKKKHSYFLVSTDCVCHEELHGYALDNISEEFVEDEIENIIPYVNNDSNVIYLTYTINVNYDFVSENESNNIFMQPYVLAKTCEENIRGLIKNRVAFMNIIMKNFQEQRDRLQKILDDDFPQEPLETGSEEELF